MTPDQVANGKQIDLKRFFFRLQFKFDADSFYEMLYVTVQGCLENALYVYNCIELLTQQLGGI